jgi:hypothetical protein
MTILSFPNLISLIESGTTTSYAKLPLVPCLARKRCTRTITDEPSRSVEIAFTDNALCPDKPSIRTVGDWLSRICVTLRPTTKGYSSVLL